MLYQLLTIHIKKVLYLKVWQLLQDIVHYRILNVRIIRYQMIELTARSFVLVLQFEIQDFFILFEEYLVEAFVHFPIELILHNNEGLHDIRLQCLVILLVHLILLTFQTRLLDLEQTGVVSLHRWSEIAGGVLLSFVENIDLWVLLDVKSVDLVDRELFGVEISLCFGATADIFLLLRFITGMERI